MPVRGSSLPMNGVRWLEYQMMPLESPDTSCVASSVCGSSYSVTTTLVAGPRARGNACICGNCESRPAHPRQPFHQHVLLLLAGPRAAAHDQRRAAEVQHAKQDQAPAPLIVAVAHDLVVAVAAFAAGAAERVVLLRGARQIPQPFDAAEL